MASLQSAVRVLIRWAARRKVPDTADAFAADFFRRHPRLKRFAPNRVLDKTGGSGAHPEARQAGDDVWLFPKFWALDGKTRDFVFAHELGHLALSRHGLAKMMDLATAKGLDPWDVGSLPFGQHNFDEAFADSFATYHLDPGELKSRYPVWVELVEAVV